MDEYKLTNHIYISFTQQLSITSAYSHKTKKKYNVYLYKIKNTIAQEQLESLSSKVVKQNSKQINKHIVYYQHIYTQISPSVGMDQQGKCKYQLGLIRQNKPLTKILSITMSYKEKISIMLNIAKAIKSLNKSQYFNIRLSTNDIYLDSNHKIKIDSILKKQINSIEMKHQSISYQSQNNNKSDIWRMAVVFIEIVLQTKLKIKWENPPLTLKSLKTLLKYTKQQISYPLRKIIKKMIKFDDKQITIKRLVSILKKLTSLSQYELRRQKIKYFKLSLVDHLTTDQYQFTQIDLQHQRIIILQPYQIFLTLIKQRQLLFIQVTHNSLQKPLLRSSFTYQKLPKEIKANYNDLYSLFVYLQGMDFKLMKLQVSSNLSFPCD